MNIPARTIFKVLSIILLFYIVVMVAWAVHRELIWIGTAFFLAVALNPVVGYLTQYMPKRSRGMAVTTVFMAFLLLLGFLVTTLVPPLVSQSELFVRNFPGYTNELVNGDSLVSEKIREYNLVDRVRDSQDQILGTVSAAGGSFFSIISSTFSRIFAVVTILVLACFMMLEGPKWLAAFWLAIPSKRREHARSLVTQMYDAVTGYVTGNILTSMLVATLTSIMLAIVGVPYAIPLGILVGLFDFIPLVGATVGATIVILAALFSSTGAAIIMLIFFFVYQQVENHVLQPLIYGRTVSMSPLLVLISVLIGASLAGIIGAIVAIPVGASVQILVKDFASRRLKAN